MSLRDCQSSSLKYKSGVFQTSDAKVKRKSWKHLDFLFLLQKKPATSQKNKLFLVETAEWFSCKGAKHKKHYKFWQNFLVCEDRASTPFEEERKKKFGLLSLMVREEIKGLYVLYTFH